MPVDASKFLNGMKDAREAKLAAMLKAVDQFGEHVIGDAQQLCPVRWGYLQASGTTEPAKIEGEQVSKTMGFNKSYAAAVHEKLNAHHTVGEAKYLENAMNQNAPKFSPFVSDRVREVGGG